MFLHGRSCNHTFDKQTVHSQALCQEQRFFPGTQSSVEIPKTALEQTVAGTGREELPPAATAVDFSPSHDLDSADCVDVVGVSWARRAYLRNISSCAEADLEYSCSISSVTYMLVASTRCVSSSRM